MFGDFHVPNASPHPSDSHRIRLERVVEIINMPKKLLLGCCKVYISESRNRAAVHSIERAAKLFQKVALVNKFEDDIYNRTGYTLVSELSPKPDSCALEGAVFSMIKAALELIDFNEHCGSHPRLGVVDHVCFHPLACASMDQVVSIAKSLASNFGSRLEVPTFLYGSAHEQGRTLDLIRRELGYFKPNMKGNLWAGGPSSKNLPLPPDEGPRFVDQSRGVVVIGATKWVDNYNVPIFSNDVAAVRRIAKRVSGRGGGLSSVQAMALAHGEDVVEVACNLLEPSVVGGDRVQLEVERLAREEGQENQRHQPINACARSTSLKHGTTQPSIPLRKLPGSTLRLWSSTSSWTEFTTE